MEDEPRKQPKPVPFCQNPLIQPTVPEVSLILQDKIFDNLKKTKDSVTGSEFQTYNAWKWKQTDLNNENLKLESSECKKLLNSQEFHLIKDNYCHSDIEKRKNEILYNQFDEPRRPLPPRSNPVIPESPISYFNFSLKNLSLTPNSETEIFHREKLNSSCNHNETPVVNSVSNKKELDDEKKLYNIISKQNNQIAVLQNQVDQVLKLQEIKDKHIEQLLKSQELKEKKIEQLLQSINTKDKNIAQLTKTKEKQEQQLLELKAENARQNEKLLECIKKMEKKMCSVGVMTDLKTNLTSCNTSCNINHKRESGTSNNENNEKISFVGDLNETDFEGKNNSLSLQLSDLPTVQEHIPTPIGSIHVDIQDFHDSSEDSNSDLETNSFPASKMKSNSLGYTFYNNVLSQVKEIIHNSKKEKKEIHKENFVCQPLEDSNLVKEKVEKVQSLQAWQLLDENISPFSLETKGRNMPERFQDDSSIITCNDAHSPSDISLKINALALKYLKQDQISQYNFQGQIPLNSYQRDVTIYNVTNLSFGSVRCVDKYHQLLSKSKGIQREFDFNQNKPSSFQLHHKRKKNLSTENILDISKINQQPKLL